MLPPDEFVGQQGEQFRLALEASPTGMLMVDEVGRIVLVNAQIERLFGYPRAELLERPVEMLVPERYRGRHPGFRRDFLKQPQTRPMGAGRDLYGLRRDGTEIPIEIGLNPLVTQNGSFVLSSVADITERKRAQERLEMQRNDLDRKNREREVLLKEVYHRVKNNLQVISSLLNLQAGQVSDAKFRDLLAVSQNRVYSIALVHEQLYQSSDLARIDCGQYVQHLISHLQGLWIPDDAVRIRIDVHDVQLPVDVAVPLGLIINELVTNSMKHAFEPGQAGEILVRLANTSPRSITLTVSDNGKGLPQAVDPAVASSLGLELVTGLAKQLRAQLQFQRGTGTSFQLAFDHA